MAIHHRDMASGLASLLGTPHTFYPFNMEAPSLSGSLELPNQIPCLHAMTIAEMVACMQMTMQHVPRQHSDEKARPSLPTRTIPCAQNSL